MGTLNGLIIKAISGFYYVEAADTLYECKARGVFRKKGISPSVGDRVTITVMNDDKASLDDVLPRKNYLIRPPLANLDRLFIVSSVAEPSANTVIIDKITAVAVSKGIEPVVIFTKSDLADCSELLEIYKKAGIKAFCYSINDRTGSDEIISLLENRISAFTGNTGVGKSSLLNSLFPNLNIETGEISRKLGRGRHTTRHSELYKVGGGYVADTPGFSTVDIERYEIIKRDELAYCFPEFEPYINNCKFTSCSHTCERGCAVIEAVNNGEIPVSRHNSYKFMYDEVKSIPDWQQKK
ncbi:MAG: ribosome small subunit-dependent GTPase A [Clostridia bacterium]|nr:ribosome small subunit-dependent GTPase A [Clostridia bacterium]